MYKHVQYVYGCVYMWVCVVVDIWAMVVDHALNFALI